MIGSSSNLALETWEEKNGIYTTALSPSPPPPSLFSLDQILVKDGISGIWALQSKNFY